jgi:PAS domain S-box-containing protein
MGKNWFETCLHPGERIAAVNLFNRQIAADGQSGERNEYCLVTADERIRHVAWYGNLLHDEKGAVIGMLCAGEDITERKLAEKVVKTEKFRQNILLTLSQVPGMSVNGVMDHALDTALLLTESVIGYLYFYSEAARQFTLYSWSKEAMNRCTVVERQTIYNLDETGLWGDAVRLRQPVITNEYPAANPRKKGLPEGHVHLQRHMNVPVFDDGVIVAVIGVANKEQPYDDDDIRHLQLLMDGIWKIKKRIDMEDQIRHLNEDLERKVDERTGELRRVHEELQRFFTLSLDLLCITDVNGRFVRCNKAWESMLGYSPGDIEQRRFLDFVHPDDLDATVAQFGELLKGRDVEFVNRYRGADGSYRWLEWHSTAAGNLMYAAARDITGKKHDEEVLIKAKDEADQANRAKSRFIANVSHEIRTPLNAVIGYSELLGAQAKGKKAQGYVESISLAGRNLLRLIDDILDLSKIEADMLTFRYGAVDLSVLLREIGQIFSFNIREKNLSFSVDTDSRLPRFLILDEVRMRQILLNIVGNAVKFTDEGHIRVTARCVPSSSERSMVDLDIVVEDTGIGIAPEEKETIFEAFRQQNNQLPRYGGTGLGLSISRKLLERMHGSITVESSPGKGSRFIIRLPDIAIASVVPTSLDSMEYGRGPAFPPLTVLVVDDIPSNRDMIAALLGQAGFKVLAAQNGEVAVELALRHRPDCIIMDVLMPVLDGIAAARILRREPLTASVPIIALTTMPSTELNDIGDAGLFSGRLGKPVFARDLFGELEKHLPGLTRGQRAEVREHDAGDGALSSDDNLPDSFRQKAGEFLGAVKMDDIRIFAQDLIDLGERNGKTVFIRVGKVLAEHADHFNVVEVKGILRKLAG